MRLGIVPERVKRSILSVIFAVVLAPNVISQSDQLPPATRMKVLGLIGGTSWYSTVDYYRYINKAVNDAYKNNTNPPLIVFNLNQQHINELQDRGQWDEIAAIFVETINRLRASGAQGKNWKRWASSARDTPWKILF